MTAVLANVFTPSSTNFFFIVFVTGLSAFIIGFLLKAALLTKYKRRVLSLEDEMLVTHARILDLEKQVAELKEENAKLRNTAIVPKVELKVS